MDKESLLELIKSLQKEKEDKRIEPTHILEVELFNCIVSKARGYLNELYAERRIKVIRTINNKAIKVTKPS